MADHYVEDPAISRPLTVLLANLSGAPGDDAKHYQERDLKRAIQKVQS
jgi:hypothetical protein